MKLDVGVGGKSRAGLPRKPGSQSSDFIDKSFNKLRHQATYPLSRVDLKLAPRTCNTGELSNPPIMSLDPPTYLSSLQNNIRARPIPWDGAVRAGTISEDQLNKIRAVDKVRKEQRKQIIEGDLDGYRNLFVGGSGKQSVLESAASSPHVTQYVLVLLGDLLDGMNSCLHYYQKSNVF